MSSLAFDSEALGDCWVCTFAFVIVDLSVLNKTARNLNRVFPN